MIGGDGHMVEMLSLVGSAWEAGSLPSSDVTDWLYDSLSASWSSLDLLVRLDAAFGEYRSVPLFSLARPISIADFRIQIRILGLQDFS
ncbi:MAG: hypothetical protein U5K69_27185 [Balneolaceae bacterium]|nr:hypothetical protein [Balneolaceae bacterium]